MGNGIPCVMNCCNKTDRNGKDIEINRINSKINSIKDFNSPTKETQKDNNNFENLMKTDIKKNKYKKNSAQRKLRIKDRLEQDKENKLFNI